MFKLSSTPYLFLQYYHYGTSNLRLWFDIKHSLIQEHRLLIKTSSIDSRFLRHKYNFINNICKLDELNNYV